MSRRPHQDSLPGAGALPAVLVEAFTDGPFAGNGAGVVLLEHPLEDGWLQGVAGSLRQSETAFLLPCGEGWLLRWFTPSCEVPLCGHATLAAVLALRHWGRLAAGTGTWFQTRSGRLEVSLAAGAPPLASLQLPSPGLREAPVPAVLISLLQHRLGWDCTRFWTSSLGYAVALLPEEAPLAAMAPIAADLGEDLRSGLVLMQSLHGSGSPARVGGEPADYQLRFFAPGLGIDEDPVTGSAHALVAPYWCERLSRSRVVGWQCSDRPGGMVCERGSSGMIRLTGTGHLLWDGTLLAATRRAAVPRDGGLEPPSDRSAAWCALAAAASSSSAGSIPS